MIYILIALPTEFPEEYQQQINKDKYRIIFTGVGKVNASIATVIAGADENAKQIINYGTAGTLKPELAGKLLSVGVVRQRDMDARPQAPLGVTPFDDGPYSGDIVLNSKTTILSTGDNFVTSTPELESDLVDMEGYAIAKTGLAFGKKVTLIKYASDFADEDAAETWQKNQANGAQKFLDLLNMMDEYDM